MIIETFQALLTPTIALTMAYIAYQQYRLRQDERNLELYDRRLAVFRNVRSLVDQARKGLPFAPADVFTWASSVAEVEFLFGEEVQVVIDELFGALLEYAGESEPMLKGHPYTVGCAEAVDRIENFHEAITETFGHYLQLPHARRRRKRRLSVNQARKLIPVKPNEAKGIDEDVPF